MKIIALYSDRPGCGKSTVARILAQKNAYVVPFAGPLKYMVRMFLDQVGIHPLLAVDYVHDPEFKEMVIPVLGVSAGHMMQTLGTEWGRDCINENVWVITWLARLRKLPEDAIVVVDDLRFPNEWAAIEELGGEIWKVSKPMPKRRKRDVIRAWLRRMLLLEVGHRSEGGLRRLDPDIEIVNDGTIDELREQVEVAFNG